MTLIAMIEPIPTDNAGNQAGDVREISVRADSYEPGVSELRGQVPEGWRLMNIRRDSP